MSDTSFLPIDFINRMERDLGPDFHAFLRSYDDNKINALRFNCLKARADAVDAMADMLSGKVDWSLDGYYYLDSARPGLHPYHYAGVIYIQDASAQLPAEMLNPTPGDFVLDLCAAPGGKSTQLAAKLKGEGLLVSNEPIANRAKILSENIERMGIKNAVVVSEYPDKLANKFPEYFDKIMVDAPCSGEGMFRKNHDACSEWSLDSVISCATRQAEILERAYEMLIPGGSLCYSTCTFSRTEDEEQIERFIMAHPDMSLIEERRLWPHEVRGEGHYAALLKKADDGRSDDCKKHRKAQKIKPIAANLIKDYTDFIKKSMTDKSAWMDNLYLNNDMLYKLPENCLDLSGIHVLRGGLFLGNLKKNRFEPAHSLAMALKTEDVKNTINLALDGGDIYNYLKGQSITAHANDGWNLVCVDSYSVGWGKAVNGQIKNHFPKGLRIMG